MNKTIIININGIIFHIEEDAYEVLRSYMTDVKRHFASEEDSIEITTDIENRIAEMFTEILAREARQVVVTADVTLVISQMGTIEDFETEQKGSYADYETNIGSRKLFRDTDDHLVGGVCSGIANYFDVDSIWIRLVFGIAIAFGGTGFIAYIILWIIVPKATTRADKMAMKGERLDLKGFVRNFEEEVKNVHSSLSQASTHARPLAYKVRDFTGDFFDHLRYFLQSVGRITLKLVGVIILLACLGFIISAVVALSFIVAQGRDVFHIFPFNIINEGYDIIYFSAFAVASIPLLAVILLTLRVIFNNNVMGRSTGYTMLILWIAALGTMGYYSSKVAADFKEGAAFSQTINIKPPLLNTYYLKLNDIKQLSKEDSIRLNINEHFNGKLINDDEDDNRHETKPQNMNIYIERSTDVLRPTLEESFSARGKSYQDALLNARNTTYYFNQKDSVLTFDATLKAPFNSLWRNQEIKLTLRIPENSTVVIDKNMNRYINNRDLYDCSPSENSSTATFIMTNNGLQCKVDTLQQTPPQQ